MNLTEEQVKHRAEVFRGLIQHPGWVMIEEEMKETAESKTMEVMNDLVNDRFEDRAIVWGIKMVLDIPYNAIKELNELEERKQLTKDNHS